MAGPITWSVLRNYLVDDGLPDPAVRSDLGDSSPQDDSLWARAVREGLGLVPSGGQPQQIFGAPIGNALWPPLPPGDRLLAGPMSSSPFLPPRDVSGASSPLQGASPLGSQFGPSPLPPSVSAGSQMTQMDDWPGSAPFAPSIPTGPMPVGYAGMARPRPWPLPGVFDPWGPWREQFLKGLEGAIKHFSGAGSRTSSGNREDDCYKRYEEEEKDCDERYWRTTAKGQNRACKDRAKTRWDMCNRNGGTPHPDEPSQWGDKDEEVWRNFNR
jgi:hypothetical protein